MLNKVKSSLQLIVLLSSSLVWKTLPIRSIYHNKVVSKPSERDWKWVTTSSTLSHQWKLWKLEYSNKGVVWLLWYLRSSGERLCGATRWDKCYGKPNFRESRRKDKKVLFFQSLDKANFETVMGATTSKQAWEILENAHKGIEKLKNVWLLKLQAKFKTLQMKESKIIVNYFTRVLFMMNQLRRNSEKLEDVQ